MKKFQIKKMTNIAAIAAIYVGISLVLNVLSFGPIQIRIAEVLIITAVISKDGIYGTTLGCFLTNLFGTTLGFSSLGIVDVVGGSLLTLMSATAAYHLRDYTFGKSQVPFLSLFMPVIFNMLGLPLIFTYVLHDQFILARYLSELVFIFIGQFISCVILGYFIYKDFKIQLEFYLGQN